MRIIALFLLLVTVGCKFNPNWPNQGGVPVILKSSAPLPIDPRFTRMGATPSTNAPAGPAPYVPYALTLYWDQPNTATNQYGKPAVTVILCDPNANDPMWAWRNCDVDTNIGTNIRWVYYSSNSPWGPQNQMFFRARSDWQIQ